MRRSSDAPVPDPAPSSGDLRVGQVVGGERYILKQILGQGGMGVVWLAHDKRLREPVALKFLPALITADAAALENLRRETLRSRKLSHPNIIRIYDLHEAPNERAFISMEYMDGPDLHSLRSRRASKVLTWKFLAPLARQLCVALEYAHGEGIIHRDIKPANLMVASNERLKLADFGLACVIHGSKTRVSSNPSAGAGTLHYMSPQQADGKKPGVTDDIYALGATLYELLTSQAPFSTGDIAYQVRNTRPQAMAERLLDLELANTIPSEVSALVMACLAKDPQQRPQSANAILQWLEAAEQQPVEPAQVLVPSPKVQPTPKPARPQPTESQPAPEAEELVVEPLPSQGGKTGAMLFALSLAALVGFGLWNWNGREAKQRDGAATPDPSNSSAYTLLFNGRDLSGWEGDPRIWSVKDNMIVGQATRGVSGSQTNTHLFWREQVGNFELRFLFKLESGNAGVVYRSQQLRDWDAGGYQYPISINSSASLIDSGWDRPRRDLARVTKSQSKLFRDNEWNEAAIIAQDNHLIHRLNGVMVCDVTDTEESRRTSSGLLAFACRPGEYTDTTVCFKDIRLRRLR